MGQKEELEWESPWVRIRVGRSITSYCYRQNWLGENSFIANYCTYLITDSGIEKQKRKGNKHSNKWGKHLSSPFLRLDFTLDSSIVTADYAVPSERLQVVQGLQPALSISPLCFFLLLFFTLSQVLHGDIPLGNFCSGHLEHLLLFLFLFLCLLLGVPSAISHSSSLLPFPVWQFLALNPLSLRCHHLGCRQVMQVMELAGTGCVQQGAAPAPPHRAALQPPDSAWLWTASTDATTTWHIHCQEGLLNHLWHKCSGKTWGRGEW